MIFFSTKFVFGYKNVCIQNTNQESFLTLEKNLYNKVSKTKDFFMFLCSKKYAYNLYGKNFFLSKDNMSEIQTTNPYEINSIVIEKNASLDDLHILLINKLTIQSVGLKDECTLEWLSDLSNIIENTSISYVEFNYSVSLEKQLVIKGIFSNVYCQFNDSLSEKKLIFVINELFYIEAKHFNPYYNSKLLIKNNGGIYNSILNGNRIKSKGGITPNENWFSTKEKTDVCMSCEYRFMCFDKKIPILRNAGRWYHNEECDYNPYIAKWKGDNGYQTLSECSIVSDENGFSIDDEKVAKINKLLCDGEETKHA